MKSKTNNLILVTANICPDGWKMPSHDYNAPAGSIESMSGSSQTVVNAFSPTSDGIYNNGSISNLGNGYWWSTSPCQPSANWYYCLNYNSSNNTLNGGALYRNYGVHIRCVRASN